MTDGLFYRHACPSCGLVTFDQAKRQRELEACLLSQQAGGIEILPDPKRVDRFAPFQKNVRKIGSEKRAFRKASIMQMYLTLCSDDELLQTAKVAHLIADRSPWLGVRLLRLCDYEAERRDQGRQREPLPMDAGDIADADNADLAEALEAIWLATRFQDCDASPALEAIMQWVIAAVATRLRANPKPELPEAGELVADWPTYVDE